MNRLSKGRRYLLLLAMVSLLKLTALAVQTSSLSGRVTDSRGAAILGAEVEALNVATNSRSTAVTTSEGQYVFAALPPGRYRLTARMQNFQSAVKADVVLNVDARVSEDFTLEAGRIEESVMVEATGSLIERESAVVGTVVDRTFVENIPLNGRSFQSLIELTPGVTLAASSATSPGQFSVNGQRTSANYFMVDGVSANASTTPIATSSQQASGSLPSLTVLGGFNSLVSVDELQEFRVQTSGFAPEYGRSPGAQISLVSRSGTNRLTGSLFDYVRNDAFDANNFFNNRAGRPRGVLRQHNFGGTVGGPIFLPRFGEGTPYFYDGRDRTFFFFSYEGLRLRQPAFRDVLVPSTAARTAAPATIQPLLNSFPLPNAPPLAADPANTGRYRQSLSNPSGVDATSVRIDHHVGDNLSLFARYKNTPSSADLVTTAFPNQTNFFQLDTATFTTGAI